MLGIGDSMAAVLLVIGSLLLVKGLPKFIESGYKHYVKAQLNKEIRKEMFGPFAGMDFSHYAKYNTGHVLNLFNNQISDLIESFDKFKLFVSSIITVAAYLIFALLISCRVAVTAILAGYFVNGSHEKPRTRRCIHESCQRTHHHISVPHDYFFDLSY